jgi:hypothetical protein
MPLGDEQRTHAGARGAVQAGSAPGGGVCYPGGRFRETPARKQRLANPAAPRAEMGDTVRARQGV